ncbi:MAG TPA: hypothetical protein EYH19_06700 [Desulfocapsa sulfexigens]|nr:hypothetical protein [Desulfocapsa sulfexigens]
MTLPDKQNCSFFLGGHDLEMLTILELLKANGIAAKDIFDKQLAWGAAADDYRQEIQSCFEYGRAPVLIELADREGKYHNRAIVIDHHNESAGQDVPTSLHQVFDLLGLAKNAWTRWHELVAANDRGYIPALLAVGATQQEIQDIRAADRAAQGVTPEEEKLCEDALTRLEYLLEGSLVIARLPHNRTSPLCDRLEPALGGAGYRNLLVFCPREVNFFGSGRLVEQLAGSFPGCWYGGALPEYGFWGMQGTEKDLREKLLERLSSPAIRL